MNKEEDLEKYGFHNMISKDSEEYTKSMSLIIEERLQKEILDKDSLILHIQFECEIHLVKVGILDTLQEVLETIATLFRCQVTQILLYDNKWNVVQAPQPSTYVGIFLDEQIIYTLVLILPLSHP